MCLFQSGLDGNWAEDRCTIRTGHGPENILALRRFAIGAVKAKFHATVAATIRRPARNVRPVFDYLRMTENSRRRYRRQRRGAGTDLPGAAVCPGLTSPRATRYLTRSASPGRPLDHRVLR